MTTIAEKIINKYVPSGDLLRSKILISKFKRILNRLAVSHPNEDDLYMDVYTFADGSKLSYESISCKVFERFTESNMHLLFEEKTGKDLYSNLIKELKELAEDYDEYGVDLDCVIDYLEANCGGVEEWCDYLDDYEFHEYHTCEVIYYANAIEFLQKHDTSLQHSLELAGDLGYEANNLDSEILASLLKTDLAHDTFNNFIQDAKDSIERYLDDLEDEAA